MKGLTTYAETLSVYGTERAFVDGDDTPWSKAFLASAYASRGVKVRFTSGTGSEALMGHAEGCSMLYLEARCLLVTRGAGSQGVQNGSISCIALPESLPGGVRAVLAENLLASMLGLEVASGNDALASHSAIRKTAKLMLQFIPGTDFIFSGYSAVPKRDNLFGGGNFDAEDFDDYNVLQRDMQVDGGMRPVGEDETLAVRREAAQAIQAVYDELGFPAITRCRGRSGGYRARQRRHAGARRGGRSRGRRCVSGGRYQTMLTVVARARAARLRRTAEQHSGAGAPARGRRLSAALGDLRPLLPRAERDQRPQRLHRPRHRLPAQRRALGGNSGDPPGSARRAISSPTQIGAPSPKLAELGPARAGARREVIVAVGPAFGTALTRHDRRARPRSMCWRRS